jgi:hypothetical protein
MIDVNKIRSKAADRYGAINSAIIIVRLVTFISAIIQAPAVIYVSIDISGRDYVVGAILGVLAAVVVAIYHFIFYVSFSFIRPVVDVAINSFINQELLTDILKRDDQLIEIEKFKLKRTSQQPPVE